MERQDVLNALYRVKNGEMSPEEMLTKLRLQPFEDLGYAKIDHHRALRQGTGEVIFGQGKTPEQVAGIVERLMVEGAKNILITRLSPEAAAFVADRLPLSYDPASRLAVAAETPREKVGSVVVASGGTSDHPVSEEAARTAEALGSRVIRLYDVGVAGLHRLLAHVDDLARARVVVAVAGMEGALASVVGGLVDCPVIAVPTSVGYGANLGGISALLSMLNSCASGVSVVNIDNGFGAGFLANRINRMEAIS